MADELLGAPADSPAADPSASPVPATGGDPSPAQTPAEQTVPYSRFQQVVQQRNGERQQLQQLQQQLREYQAAQQQRPQSQPPPEHVEASNALFKVLEATPQGQRLLRLLQNADRLEQGYQGVQSLTQQQQRAVVGAGQRQIAEMVGKAGLPTDQNSLRRMEELVRAEIEQMPDGVARFRMGDPKVLQEAFDALSKDFIGGLRRQANVALAQTKQQTQRLPPRSGGGLPTPAAPPKLDPENPGKYIAELNALTRRMAAAGAAGPEG